MIVLELNIFQKNKIGKLIGHENITKKFIEYKHGFIDWMLKGKSLLDYTNLFSTNEYKKSDKIILKYFQ